MPFNFSSSEYLSHHRARKNRVSPVSRASPAHMNSPLVPAQEEMNEMNEVCEVDDAETTDLLDNYNSDSEDNNVDCWDNL